MVEMDFFLYDEESQTAEKNAKRGQPQIKQIKTVALNKNKKFVPLPVLEAENTIYSLGAQTKTCPLWTLQIFIIIA